MSDREDSRLPRQAEQDSSSEDALAISILADTLRLHGVNLDPGGRIPRRYQPIYRAIRAPAAVPAALMLACLFGGFGLNLLSTGDRIHALWNPVIGLVLLNLVFYVVLIIAASLAALGKVSIPRRDRPLARRSVVEIDVDGVLEETKRAASVDAPVRAGRRSKRRRLHPVRIVAGWARDMGTSFARAGRSLLRSLWRMGAQLHLRVRQEAQISEDFLQTWWRVAGPLKQARFLLYASMGLLLATLGALLGCYLRGGPKKFYVGWSSTWFEEPEQIRTLLRPLAPWARVVGLEFDTATILGLSGPTGLPAATWIHMYALLVLTLVVVPRIGLIAFYARTTRREAGGLRTRWEQIRKSCTTQGSGATAEQRPLPELTLQELQSLALDGSLGAHAELGRRFELGVGADSAEPVPQDLKDAIVHYEAAARGGHADASYRLACLRFDGACDRQDEEAWADGVRKASRDPRQARAQLDVAVLHIVGGLGCDQDAGSASDMIVLVVAGGLLSLDAATRHVVDRSCEVIHRRAGSGQLFRRLAGADKSLVTRSMRSYLGLFPLFDLPDDSQPLLYYYYDSIGAGGKDGFAFGARGLAWRSGSAAPRSTGFGWPGFRDASVRSNALVFGDDTVMPTNGLAEADLVRLATLLRALAGAHTRLVPHERPVRASSTPARGGRGAVGASTATRLCPIQWSSARPA